MKLNRLAVSIIFFIAGFMHATWVVRIPEVQQLWQVSNAMLGTILLVSAGGAVFAMPFAGVLMVKYSSRELAIFTITCLCFVVASIPLMQTLWVILPCFFLMGVFGGSMDVAINGQAIYVERLYEKPIMSSFHALFSIGTVMGSGCGALFARLQIALLPHFVIIASLCLCLIIWARNHMVRDTVKKAENIVNPDGTVTPKRDEAKGLKEGAFRLPTKAILPLGIVAFCGMSGEGAIADWSALYMNKIIGSDLSFSALAFTAFTTAMTTGRILGDYFIEKYGNYKVLIINSLLSILGLSIALFFAQPLVVLLGFFITGLGVATIVPIIYSSAGNTEGVLPSVGIAMATTVGYAGFFVAPPVIGYLADIFDLRIGLLFTLSLFVVMLVLVQRFIKT